MYRLGPALLALLLAACLNGQFSAEEAGSPAAKPTAEETVPPTSTAVATALALPDLRLEPVASGFDLPSGIAVGPEGALYVNETRSGLVRIIGGDGSIGSEPFLDLSDRIRGDGERGLLGLAFHPAYERNHRLFVHYTRRSDGAIVVAEFSSSPDGTAADRDSERVLLTVNHPTAYHNGGQLAFGPDGYLYIGIGDGSSRGDADGNAQSTDALLGKILRINVDGPSESGQTYAIPPDNPFAGGGGAPEIFVLGVRNPWRFSFDDATGAMWVADVGEGGLEEVTRLEAGSAAGANLGWSVMEGSSCYNLLPCDPTPFIGPLTEYGRDSGCAVIGGIVVRGQAVPPLDGWYVFADYCEGTIFGVPADVAVTGGQTIAPRVLLETGLPVTAFAKGNNGEPFMADIIGGTIYRLVEDDAR